MSRLEFKNVGVKFQHRKKKGINYGVSEFWALKDVNFILNRHQTLGILGKNGAGKSTVLSLIAGIIENDKGTMTNNFGPSFLLSLQAGFLNHLSGRKNVILVGMLLGLSKVEALKKMDEVIEYSELEDFIDYPVGTYSSGMRARLGFAISNAIEPDIILIDEVLGVGDRAFKEKSFKTIKSKINKSTAVIVSHNQDTLKELCEKGLVINNGISCFYGGIDDAVEAYNKL